MLSTLFRQVRFVALTSITSLAIVTAASAQGPGVAASVTSHGFGGHAGAAGVPASVTSHGSFAPNRPIMMHNPLVVNRGFASEGLVRGPVNQGSVHRGFGERPGRPVRDPRRTRRSFFPGTVVYGFPYYPYSYDYDDDSQDQAQDQQYEDQQQYQNEDQYSNNGQTIFDRRGPGPEYQTWRDQSDPQPPAPQQVASIQQQPEPAAPPTVLVFKDGHQVEVANYAIVGATLFDLTPGHPRRVALSELDINATQKQNDDRGVDFKLPTGM